MSQLLEDFKGKTKTQKLLDDIGKIYKENLRKEFPKYFEKESTKSYCIITTLENTEIKNIGMSKIDDLLLDNWGQIMGLMFLTTTQKAGIVKDIAGNLENIRFWGNGNNQRTIYFAQAGATAGMLIKTGTSASTPQRSDFNLNALTQTMISSNGAYNSGLGKVTMPSSKVSTINETIAEAGLFQLGNLAFGNSVNQDTFMISHDLINPAVPVTIGQAINVDYQYILS